MGVISYSPAVSLLNKLQLSMTDDLNAAHILGKPSASELTGTRRAQPLHNWDIFFKRICFYFRGCWLWMKYIYRNQVQYNKYLVELVYTNGRVL